MKLTIHNLDSNQVTQVTGNKDSIINVAIAFSLGYVEMTKFHLTIEYGNLVGCVTAVSYAQYTTISDSIYTRVAEFIRVHKVA